MTTNTNTNTLKTRAQVWVALAAAKNPIAYKAIIQDNISLIVSGFTSPKQVKNELTRIEAAYGLKGIFTKCLKACEGAKDTQECFAPLLEWAFTAPKAKTKAQGTDFEKIKAKVLTLDLAERQALFQALQESFLQSIPDTAPALV